MSDDAIGDTGNNDGLYGANRVYNPGGDGIKIEGTDSLIFNNRVPNIDTSNATATKTDGNLTGSAN